jgi:hypothetical protein
VPKHKQGNNSANGINTLKKHVYANHYMIEKIFKEKVTNLLKYCMTDNLQRNDLM